MTDETETKVKSKDELLKEMKVATDKGNWKSVSKVSSEIAKLVATAEKAEKAERDAALDAVSADVKKAIDKAVQPFITSRSKDEPIPLAAADGIWYSYDFGTTESTIKVIKGVARKGGGGSGGGGKKFSITTTELLAKHGSEQMGDTGKTFQQTYDEDTGGNARYKVRMKLLKAEGLS